MKNKLYEWRRFKKVRYCYACRTLKGLSEFHYQGWNIYKNGRRVRRRDYLCKTCRSIVRRKKYKMIKK